MLNIFNNTTENLPNNPEIIDFQTLLGLGVNVILGVLFVVATGGIIYSGIQFIMSKGNPKAFETAKTSLVYSLVGLVLGVGAFAIKEIIYTSLGVTVAE